MEEAKLYGKINVAASRKGYNFSDIPDCRDLDILPDSDYVYMCENIPFMAQSLKRVPDSKGKVNWSMMCPLVFV